MSDNGFTDYEAMNRRFKELSAELLPANKSVIFDALTAAGIVYVQVDFDGYGDEGSFQEVLGFNSENEEIALPGTEIFIKIAILDTGAIEDKVITPASAIEEIVSDFLEDTHPYWEDNEGAYGSFRLSVTDRSIKLEFNERFVDYTQFEHEF